MRRHHLALPLITALAAFASPAQASGNSALARGMASAEVLQPIAVTPLADLDFGVIVGSPGLAGTVVLGASEAPASYTGGAQAGCAASLGCPLPHPAKFAVTGEAGRSYTIAAPASISIPGELTLGAGGAAPSLTVSAISVNSANRPAGGTSGQLNGNGQDSFTLGGRLDVPASLPPARYRVSLQVVVSYS